MTDLSHLAAPGTEFAIRVTPKASRERIVQDQGQVRIYVTVVPEGGKANAAVLRLLSKALGVPKSRLSITRGETGRDKSIRVA